jgi:general secretion pathway protein D
MNTFKLARLIGLIGLITWFTQMTSFAAQTKLSDKRFFQARAAYLSGDLETAEYLFSQIKTPKNIQVQRYLVAIQQARVEKDSYDQKLKRWEMLESINHAWSEPQAVQNSEAASVEEPSDSQKLICKLNTILIPKINFVDVPLSQAIEILSAIAIEQDEKETIEAAKGINIVLIDPKRTDPHISLNLRNTNLKHVLEFLTQSIDFSYDIEHSAVVLRALDNAVWNLETAVFPLSRATVIRLTNYRSLSLEDKGAFNQLVSEEERIKAFLQKAGVNFETVAGSNLAFDGSDLIVTQTPRNIDRVRNIIQRYKELKQVEIEAKFLEVQEGALEEIGFRWNLHAKNHLLQTSADQIDNLRTLSQTYATQSFSGGDGVIVSPNLALPNNTKTITNRPPKIPNTVNLATSAVPFAQIYGRLGQWKLDVLIRALEQHSGSDLMSAPKLTVLSGKTAHIVVAQELRYPEAFDSIHSEVGTSNLAGGGSSGVTITAGTPRNFVVRNIGVEMDVTPTVEHDHTISLQLEPKVTEFEGFIEYGGKSLALTGSTSVLVPSGFFQPIFSTRHIQTEVTIFDGATVVMGGLTREEIKSVHDKVPVLGDIPILGRLFQSKGETTQKRNLLIFVTANLVSPAGTLYRSGKFNDTH